VAGGDADAVVRDGDAGRAATGDAVLDDAAREHAAAAVDDECIGGEIVREGVAGSPGEVQFFARI
jgi:hypothetical protein